MRDLCNLCFVNGVPDKETLEKIFSCAAVRMRLMREKLHMDPDLFEDVEFFDFVLEMQRLVVEDIPLIQDKFRFLVSSNVSNVVIFDEEVRKDCHLPGTKKKVEDVLEKDEKCAVSIMFNEHIVTGCFDAKVEFHECDNTLNFTYAYVDVLLLSG